MNISKFFIILCVFALIIPSDLSARKPDHIDGVVSSGSQNTAWRAVCVRPTKQTELQINNVRARLLTGGDVWYEAQYIVPKPAPGQLPVSALYAGGVWIGGVDKSKNIKLSAVTYRAVGFDFFSGPLDLNGATEKTVCDNWDRFFAVKGTNVKSHVNRVLKWLEIGEELDCDSIPEDVLFWPGQGNQDWRKKFSFNLPDQPLGNFWDQNENGVYEPCLGDFPTIDIRGCEPEDIYEARELIPDDMIFWIYNDNGGAQTLSGPASIQMEVQVQSFAYATNDEINDMTFYRYKLINKANEDLVDCYFSMWIDPDLGCYQDDYIGCDTSRSLAYVYNEDAIDGFNGAACGGTNTYGEVIPILGMDYFRGPLGPRVWKRDAKGDIILDANGKKILLEPEPFTGAVDTTIELGMTSFTYAENGGIGSPPPPTTDPQRGREDGFYNYIRGFWADGTPVTFGGTGYNPGSTDSIRFAFVSDPSDTRDGAWSMCTEKLPLGDRRTLQATGPLLLQPGAENELIMGVVFVPDVPHPCPDITRLRFADDIAQALFDNCFDITDGPDAPDLTPVELDRELIIMLSNEQTSNNFNESYEEVDLQAPMVDNNKYKFEGYRIFQLANASITGQELGDISKAREIAKVDLKNGVREVYSWVGQANPIIPNGPIVWTPTKEVTGTDSGIRKSFRVIDDQFALSDKRLINHKQYHFMVLAYAHNNWKSFDIVEGEGQKRPYLEGRGNVKVYTLVPRPIVYEDLQVNYGDGPAVTRIQGEGNPGKVLDMDPSMYDLIINKTFDGKILYKTGAGPIDAKVVDPLKVKNGKYRLEIVGNFQANSQGSLCSFDNNATWRLTDVTNNKVMLDNRPLTEIKEYIIGNLGFSVTVGNEDDPGVTRTGRNGGVGINLAYKNPNGEIWYNALRDGGNYNPDASATRFYDFVGNGFISNGVNQDPNSALSRLDNGFFVPILSTRFLPDTDLPFYVSPAPREVMNFSTSSNINSLKYRDLNNVDIVFTNDKSKWSKCVVVETTANELITAVGATTIGGARNFDLRNTPSIDQNGKPLNDGTVGMSYFPGYAIDVETGKRLNIFFGENSWYSGDNAEVMQGKNPIGGDLIFNPSSEAVIEDFILRNPNTGEILGQTDPRAWILGGQHNIYVTRSEYDEGKGFYERLKYSASGASPSLNNKHRVLSSVTWTSVPLPIRMLPLEQGLIPNDLTVKVRVNNPYGESRRYDLAAERACLTSGDKPIYEFEFKDVESKQLATQEEYVGALSNVNVVPNPYYAYSSYETSQFTNIIKITNLPAKAVVTIYSIDGSFVRQYNRDERGAILAGNSRPTSTGQVFPDLEWDMKNFREIPVASGVYLIHIAAPEYGEERTIKWFGIGRTFDPSGL
jgi:hypothetical protein